MTTEQEVKVAIQQILLDTKAYKTSLNWAVNYCKVALNMTGRELQMQIPYILNNITHWRNADAKNIRQILKSYMKGGDK